MSFTFPDPSVSTTATNPETGITYEYADGMWTPVSAKDAEQDTEIQSLKTGETIDRELLVNVAGRLGQAEIDIDAVESLDLTNALSALAIAQQDIIELKSKVNSLELTSFLILE